jgi:L-threonylcarbamoyladenylate synthase
MAALHWPLVASSANHSGAPAAGRLEDVAPSVRAACGLLLDGGEVRGTASTVVDLSSYAATGRWHVLREGALPRAELIAVLGLPPA